MEYEYLHDTITGSAKAKFSLEHEVMGPWLEVEVGKSPEKLTELLTAIDTVLSGKTKEVMITGHEYTVIFNANDAMVQTNSGMNGVEALPEELIGEEIDFDQNSAASCGLEDIKDVLTSWAHFIKK